MTGVQGDLPVGYGDWLAELKGKIRQARLQASLAVNAELIALYWRLGRDILDRQARDGWGGKVVERLATDLRAEFPEMRGLSRANLLYMRAFAEAWPDPEIVQRVVGRLPWGQNIELLAKLKDPAARLWYAEATLNYGWSRPVLAAQIDSRLRDRQGQAITNFSKALPPPDSDIAQQILKDPYQFDFLSLAADAKERDLERGLLGELFGLIISEGALDAAFRRGKPLFDADVAHILARLRCARVVCSAETSVRVAGRTCWNWVFQNSEVVIHVVRTSRGAGVVREVLDGHRPALWVSDLYGAQQGHAEDWQICLAHQLRDCTYATEAGHAVFAPRMKALLLRAVVLARRSRDLAPSTQREYRRRLECALDAVMALAPTHRDGQRLRRRYGKLRSHLFTFLDHPEVPADNNGSERELRPTATYRKVAGGFRSKWGADLFGGVRSVIGTAARRGVGAYQAIQQTLRGQATPYPG